MPHLRSAGLVGVALFGALLSGCGAEPQAAAERPEDSAVEDLGPAASKGPVQGTCASLLRSYLGEDFRESHRGVAATGTVLSRWLAARDGAAHSISGYPKYANIRRGERLQICVGDAAGLAAPGPPGHPMADTIIIVFPTTGAPIMDGMGPRAAVLDVFAQLRILPGARSVP